VNGTYLEKARVVRHPANLQMERKTGLSAKHRVIRAFFKFSLEGFQFFNPGGLDRSAATALLLPLDTRTGYLRRSGKD